MIASKEQFENRLAHFFQAIEEDMVCHIEYSIDLSEKVPKIEKNIQFKKKKFKPKQKNWKIIGF